MPRKPKHQSRPGADPRQSDPPVEAVILALLGVPSEAAAPVRQLLEVLGPPRTAEEAQARRRHLAGLFEFYRPADEQSSSQASAPRQGRSR